MMTVIFRSANCLIFSRGISLIVALLGFGISSVYAKLPNASSTSVPKNLQVSNDQSLLLKTAARGRQIYTCKVKIENPNQFEWVLKAPNAVLLDEQGKLLGKHYAGPTWEASDSSIVMAKVKSTAEAPQDGAIPWLLLEARSHKGSGIFSRVNWIQRLNTVGGKPPSKECVRTHQNLEVSINYTADYYFFGAKNR